MYTNHSDDGKWIVDRFRDLIEIEKDDLPLTHDPETGDALGVLVEPPSINYYPHAIDMSGNLDMSEGTEMASTSGANSILFFPQAVKFDGSWNKEKKTKSIKFTLDSPMDWWYVGVSFFVRFPGDSSPPVYGRSYIEDSDFYVKINGLESIEDGGTVKITRMNDGCYWVRTRLKTPSRPVLDFEIGNSYWQRNRDFLITGLQIEPYSFTSPIITTGEPKERDGNYVSYSAEYNRTMNPQQGTIELGYYLLPGSVGSALYAEGEESYWELGHIGYDYQFPEDERVSHSIKVEAEEHSFSIVNDKETFNLKDEMINHCLRFTYSPFGYRMTMNESLVLKSRNTNTNYKENPPTEFHLGLSEEGIYMNGYIRYFNIRARALTDEEMIIEGCRDIPVADETSNIILLAAS